jgi:hypothetical protein
MTKTKKNQIVPLFGTLEFGNWRAAYLGFGACDLEFKFFRVTRYALRVT